MHIFNIICTSHSKFSTCIYNLFQLIDVATYQNIVLNRLLGRIRMVNLYL